MKIQILFIFSIVTGVLTTNINCKGSKTASRENTVQTTPKNNQVLSTTEPNQPENQQPTQESNTTTNPNTNMEEQQGENYRFNVSFYSKGEGTDYKTAEKFIAFADGFEPKVKYEKAQWGREGETDYCFKLSELNLDQQKTFIKKAKEILNTSTLVHITENAPCVHKRE